MRVIKPEGGHLPAKQNTRLSSSSRVVWDHIHMDIDDEDIVCSPVMCIWMNFNCFNNMSMESTTNEGCAVQLNMLHRRKGLPHDLFGLQLCDLRTQSAPKLILWCCEKTCYCRQIARKLIALIRSWLRGLSLIGNLFGWVCIAHRDLAFRSD